MTTTPPSAALIPPPVLAAAIGAKNAKRISKPSSSHVSGLTVSAKVSNRVVPFVVIS
ncbi:unannotated protein [freshwater metagenome]|uniref:Unannotated protein n=1 Tax=freshwater metagenome TaxID=449393 RepID=A0A6J6IED1_9ZZZZ